MIPRDYAQLRSNTSTIRLGASRRIARALGNARELASTSALPGEQFARGFLFSSRRSDNVKVARRRRRNGHCLVNIDDSSRSVKAAAPVRGIPRTRGAKIGHSCGGSRNPSPGMQRLFLFPRLSSRPRRRASLFLPPLLHDLKRLSVTYSCRVLPRQRRAAREEMAREESRSALLRDRGGIIHGAAVVNTITRITLQ